MISVNFFIGFILTKKAKDLKYLKYYVQKPNPSDIDEDHLYNLYTSLSTWHILRSIARSASKFLVNQMYLHNHYFELVQPKNGFTYATKWVRDCYPVHLITPLDDCKLFIENYAVKEELTEVFSGDTIAIPTQASIKLTSKSNKILPFWIAQYVFHPVNSANTHKVSKFKKPKHVGIYNEDTKI